MGAKKLCDICGNPAGMMKMQYHDGTSCYKCFGNANKQVTRMYNSLSEVRKVLEQDFSNMNSEEKAAFVEGLSAESKSRRMDEIQDKIRKNNVPIKRVDTTPRCSKCGSTSISSDKKGFGIRKAVVGAAVAGPVGIAAGGIGAKKVRITCLNCGHQWMAGKA